MEKQSQPSFEQFSHQSEENENILRSAELGVILAEAYRGAIDLDPRLSEIKIVPIEDPDDKRHGYARAKGSKGNESGRHEAHIRLDNLDQTLDMYSQAMSQAPETIAIIAEKIGVPIERVTPQLLYVQSILHEIGHLTEHMDYEDDPEFPKLRRKQEMAAMPVGNVTVGALLDPESAGSKYVEHNWESIQVEHGIDSRDDLIAMQSRAYRNLTSETIADNFAADVFAIDPQLVDMLTGPSIEKYRDFPDLAKAA